MLTSELGLDQLRAALDQTQVAHEDLQLSHEDLASRYVDILQERDALVSAGQQDANTLNSVHDDQVAMKQEVKVLRKVKKEAAAQRIESERNTMELQRVLAEMEAQIDATTDDYAAHLASHQDELGTAQRQAIDKNVLIVELQKQLHDSEMQHAAVCTRMNTELDSAQRELAEHTDRVSELESQLQAISNESGTCTDYTSQVGKDLNDALYLGAEEDRVISALRDKLQMTAFERDELRVRTDGLLEECYEMERIAGETERDAAARSAAEMSASMEEERRVWADERVEVSTLERPSRLGTDPN